MAEHNASINGSTRRSHRRVRTEVWEFDSRIGWTPLIYERWEFLRKHELARSVFVWMISAIEIPIMILTLFALCVLIKSQRSAPVFVIHLILSDLIQIICTLIMTSERFKGSDELFSAYLYSLIVGLYFMACVAVERYLLVSHPIWYKTHHSLKVCCVISVIIWFVPLIFADVYSKWLFDFLHRSIACLIPYPIIILCFVGTCRGLSHAISLTPLKRKLILGSLFLVLLTYTFLILPFVVLSFTVEFFQFKPSLFAVKFLSFSICLMYVNPLADCILYLFMRPDVGGLMESVHCCCRTDTHQNSTHRRDEHSRGSSGTFALPCVSVQKPASHSRTACSSV